MSLEMNKIAAAVLAAGVVAMGSSFVAEILVHPEVPDEPHYAVAPVDRDVAEADEPAGPEPILALLADADVEAGQQATRPCQACHTFDSGGAHGAGPNLYGVVGNQIASKEGFGNYSDTLQGLDDVWTYENLNGFLHDPGGWAPGTTMTFAGVQNDQDRANIIAYLREQDDDPEPLPTEEEIAEAMAAWEGETGAGEEETAEAEEPAEAEGAEDVHAMIAAADPQDGQQAARACQACHSFDEGGAHQLGPLLYDVAGQDIARHEDFDYSDALEEAEGEWTYENLWAFLRDPEEFAPGNRMAFPGVRDDEDRAALIAYLRQQSDDPPPLEE